jgi:hypothetical protein
MTIREVLKNRLPLAVANSAILAIELQHQGRKQNPHQADDDCVDDSLDNALHSFHWDSTDEGHHYWQRIHDKYVQSDERDDADLFRIKD